MGATAVAGPVGGGGQTRGTLKGAARPLGYEGALRLVQRRRVRRAVMPVAEDQPARAVLASWMRAEQNHLGLTQDGYGDLYGVSRSSISRFWSGDGRLTAILRLNLKERHPDWAPTIDAVVLEDAERAEAREARRAAG